MNNIEIILRVLYKLDKMKKKLPHTVQLSSLFLFNNLATFQSTNLRQTYKCLTKVCLQNSLSPSNFRKRKIKTDQIQVENYYFFIIIIDLN